MVDGNKLKAAGVLCGMTCGNMAVALGLSRTTLSLKMNGKAEFTLGEVEDLANLLHLTRDQIFDIFFN